MHLSPTAGRTRRDIVAAAISCWAEDSSTSLAVIARRAEVGRTTLNRYFSGRTALVAAVDTVCRERMARAAGQARLADGPGLAALQRLALAVLEQEGLLGLIFSDNPVIDPDGWEDQAGTAGLTEVVARGQRDGSLDASVPADWIETVLWTTLFAGHLGLRAGRGRHEVGRLVSRTLAHGTGSG